MYTPTKWNTVEDKEKFVVQFKKFIEKGFPKSLFTKAFYTRMSMMRGHIAHYNQGGFFDAQFSTSERRADFLNHWTVAPCYGDPEWTYSDVERVLAAWLRDNPEYESRERNQHAAIIEDIERKELARLSGKYGEKWAHTTNGTKKTMATFQELHPTAWEKHQKEAGQ